MSGRVDRSILKAAEGRDAFLRDLVGVVVLLLLVRAAEPLFFGPGYYATLSAHPYWIVVILAATQGGILTGIVGAAVATMLMDWPPRPVGVDITAHYVALAVVPVQWLLAAVIIGAFREGHMRREDALAADNALLVEMAEDLAAEIERLDAEIDALELDAATRADAGDRLRVAMNRQAGQAA